MYAQLLRTELCLPSPLCLYAEALTSNVTIFGDTVFKEVIEFIGMGT